jgi:lipid A 3-O-deacylase
MVRQKLLVLYFCLLVTACSKSFAADSASPLMSAVLDTEDASEVRGRKLVLRDELSRQATNSTSEIWESGVGEGFSRTARSFSVELGALYGMAIFGSQQQHHLALASLSYGHIWGPIRHQNQWCRGNWEWRIELFGGGQFSPTDEWVIGLTPHLRYNFATGCRLVPFIDAGAGVTATGIRPPDLSNTFEFNLQATVGVQWFVRDNLALTLDARYMHMSCAGISSPNLGLNGVMGMLGLTWLF